MIFTVCTNGEENSVHFEALYHLTDNHNLVGRTPTLNRKEQGHVSIITIG